MPLSVLICRSNPIDPDPRVEKVARTLASAGYPVRVLAWDRTGKLPTAVQADGYRIDRLPIRAAYARGVMNFPQLLRWQIGQLKWLLAHRKEYDLIHACDFDTVLPALICKKALGKWVVYDIFDFYADHLRATPDTVKRLIRWVDLRTISLVDAVILADDYRKEQISGSYPKQLEVIYNSPEEARLNPVEVKPASVNHRLKVAYVGLLQVERGLPELLEVMRAHPEWELQLAGFGGDEARIYSLASQLPNVHCHGRIPYEQAIRLSSEADVLIATYDPRIPNHRYASPNKVYEAMMLGKPIIVAKNTSIDQLIGSLECGMVVNYGDIEELGEALEFLETDPDLRSRLGRNARQAYDSRFSWEICRNRLLRLYANFHQ